MKSTLSSSRKMVLVSALALMFGALSGCDSTSDFPPARTPTLTWEELAHELVHPKATGIQTCITIREATLYGADSNYYVNTIYMDNPTLVPKGTEFRYYRSGSLDGTQWVVVLYKAKYMAVEAASVSCE